MRRLHRDTLQSHALRQEHFDDMAKQKAYEEKVSTSLRQKIFELEQQLHQCQAELRTCKDDLFQLQPTGQIPDSRVAEDFEKLVEAICNWIDTEVSRHLDDWHFQNPDESPRLFYHGRNEHAWRILKHYPDTAGEYLVRCHIQQQLCEKLFDQSSYLFALGIDAQLLQMTEEQMFKLSPHRDAKTIRAWRSESLTSIVALPFYQSRLAKERWEVTNEIFEAISAYIPVIEGDRTSLQTFYEKIMIPAVDLSVRIQTSSTIYTFEPVMTSTNVYEGCYISRKSFREKKFIDAETGKTLKPDSPVTEDRHGYVGEQLLHLTPSLMRCVPSKNPTRLTQSVILLELYHPLGKRGATTPQTGESAGLTAE